MRISEWSSDVCSSDLMVGKSFDFLMDLDGNPITPTMIYKRALSPDDWTRRGLDSSILHRKAFQRGLLTGETANPIMRALASQLLNSAELEQALKVTQLSDNQHFRSEEHTSELQSLMRISYAVFIFKKQNNTIT